MQILTSADGNRLALHDLGGTGRPLLLTHGNGLNAGMWVAVAPLLAERFHCFGVDFRGHGAAGPSTLDLPIERERFAEDLLTAVEAVGGAPALTAGHSLGGVATVKVEQMWPGTFEAAWLFEPVLIPDSFDRPPDDQITLVEIARRRRQEFDSVDDFYERLRAKPPFSTCRPETVRAYAEIGTLPLEGGGRRLSMAGELEARVFETSEPQDLSTYSTIRCPMVIACGGGAAGEEVPALVAPLVAEALGDARLEVYEHLSHFGPMEDPETIAASIIAHLGPYAS